MSAIKRETTARDRAIEDIASLLEQLAEPTVKHGKWILGQLARQVRALAGAPTTDEASRHGVTLEPPAGSEHFREGWRTGYEQAEIDADLRWTEHLARRAPTTDEARFLRWLVAMDDPNDVEGREARRTMTLTRIIDRARELLAATPEGVDAADELERLRHERERVLVALRAEGDPVRAASFVREAADSFAARVAELEAEPGGMDLEAQGEMADELAAAQAAIQRVRAVIQGELDVDLGRGKASSARLVTAIRCALDEEKR